MLELSRCSIMASRFMDLASTVTTLEEGVPMIHVIENGKGVIQPAAGAGGEKFAGVSQFKQVAGTTGRMVESFTVPASGAYTVTLSRTPSGSSTDRGVKNAAGSLLTSAGSVGSASQYNLTGKVVTVDSSLAGQTLEVSYQYALSAAESVLLQGNDIAVVDLTGSKSMGIITDGHIYTSCFDPNVNWATTASIKLGAGVFTGAGGSGVAIPATIVSVPTPGDPWLGVYINLPI